MATKQKILTDENRLEKNEHGSDEYKFRYYYEDIWDFDLHCIDWHWHPEVEFVYLKKGEARMYVGSERHDLHEGEGVFINSQVLHRFESDDHAIIPNIVFSPILLASEESLIYKKYIAPVISAFVSCQIFNVNIPWQKNVIELLNKVFRVQKEDNNTEIDTLRFLLGVWHEIFINMDLTKTPLMARSDARTQANIQIMMQYIHNHYKEKILLDDIASSANVSKSTALNIFNNCLHTAPINYLIRYRLGCAAKLLKSTETSILNIAENTGFDNAGYFCRKFKDLYKMTPSEYRKAAR